MYEAKNSALGQTAMSTVVDRFAEFLNETITEFNPDFDITTSPEEIASDLRKTTAEIIKDNDRCINQVSGDMAALALGCRGPFTMVGTPDNRREYTVSVCAAPNIPDDVAESAVIKRTKL
jgi:hypothetical protein